MKRFSGERATEMVSWANGRAHKHMPELEEEGEPMNSLHKPQQLEANHSNLLLRANKGNSSVK